MFGALRKLARLTWRQKWEHIVGLIGLFFAGMEAEAWSFGWIVAVIVGLILLVDVSLFVVHIWRELRVKHVPLIVAAGVGDDEFVSMVGKVWRAMDAFGFSLDRYERDYGLDRLRVTVHRERDLPQSGRRWRDLVGKYGDRLIRLDHDLTGQKVVHVFLNCPVALSVGLGAVAGTRYESVVHQYPRGGGDYDVVLDSLQKKEKAGQGIEEARVAAAEPFQYVAAEEPEAWSPRLFVALQLGGFPLGPRVAAEADEAGAATAHIHNTYDDHLPADADWLLVAREVRTILVRWLEQPAVEQIDLFISGPVPLYYLVGAALGNFLPVVVYQWFSGSDVYKPVLKLDDLKRYG